MKRIEKFYINLWDNTVSFLSDLWWKIRAWWYFNYEICFLLIIIAALLLTPCVLLYFRDMYLDSKYDFTIQSDGQTYWLNKEDFRFDGRTIIIEDDKTVRVLNNYVIEDNRNNDNRNNK